MPKGHLEVQADIMAFFEAGLKAYSVGDFNHAHHAFSDVLALDPAHFESLHYLARCAAKRSCWSFAAASYISLKSSAYYKSHSELDTEITILVSVLSYLTFRKLAALPVKPISLKEIDRGLGLVNAAMDYILASQKLGVTSPYLAHAHAMKKFYKKKKIELLPIHIASNIHDGVRLTSERSITNADDYHCAIRDLLLLRIQAEEFVPDEKKLITSVNTAILALEGRTRTLRFNDVRTSLPTLLSLDAASMGRRARRAHLEMLKLKLIIVDELLVNVHQFDERQQVQLTHFKQDLEACIEKTEYQKKVLSYQSMYSAIPEPDTLEPADCPSWLQQLYHLKDKIPDEGFSTLREAISKSILEYESVISKNMTSQLFTLTYTQSRKDFNFSDQDAIRIKNVLNEVSERPMSDELREVLINMKHGTLPQKIHALVLTLKAFVKPPQRSWFSSASNDSLLPSFEEEAPEKIVSALKAP